MNLARSKPRSSKIPALALVALCAAGCGREWVAELPGACVFDSDCFEGLICIDGRCVDIELGEPDGGTRLKEFGEQCEANEECRSTYCLPHPAGSFCTRTCDEGCPAGWECKLTPDPHGGPEPIGLCAVVQNRLCRSCVDDFSCNVTGSDLCLEIGDGEYCTVDCTFGDCPYGYTCTTLPVEPASFRQCLPDNDTCSCSGLTEGMLRGCERSNQHGTCGGFAECLGDPGWSDCSAPEPSPEICNGLDDDCDGFADEDLQAAACESTNEHGTCSGFEDCRGFEGWVCQAPEPAPEDCNILDDDCDGELDEDFRDGQGRYLHDDHCGSCGTACADVIAHATRTECRLEGGMPVCRALACEDGWFVYADGLTCLALPANLCMACSMDADCLAPGSRCVENDTERYCGRSCAPGSPYGTYCPVGYSCRAYGDGLQCLPDNDTCLCGSSTVGTVRSCVVDTCVGFEECSPDGDDYAWTPCNVEDFNVEICDGLDNNCNGRIDEGFLNPATGRYESDDHCGFCNNDCSLYFQEEIHHVHGVCDIAGLGMPECSMGPCLTEMEGGQRYEWVDVNGSSHDGCECRRVFGNTDGDPPDLFAEPEPGLIFVDENCDGVDGVIDDALFVRAGSSGGDGGLERPFGTIAQALAAFEGSGKRYVLAAEGRYDEDVALIPGVELHGGYAADFLGRDVVLHASVITGRSAWATLTANGIQAPTVVSGLVIRGRDADQAASDDVPGEPSVAVHLVDCDSGLALRSNQILAGRGGDGGRGSSGPSGFGRADSPQLDGRPGRDGQRLSGMFTNGCPAGRENPGGAGGTNAQCPQSDGNPGGTTVCPVFDWNLDPVRGSQAEYTSGADGNGLGGFDWSFDWMSSSTCSHATESGYPTDIQLNVAQDGADGQDGASGQGGAGGSGRYGSVSAYRWCASPDSALAGTDGLRGEGGGGGGGGGGTAYYPAGGCYDYEIGPSGGGSGAGGCGGSGGQPGRQGGAAIAIMVARTGAGPATAPQLLYNVIQRGQGGRGGDGGFGGQGGLGGVGGFGGDPPAWISSLGGKGGDGANGGPGGGGGGGPGGPSFDLVGFDVDPAAYQNANLFPLDADAPTAGPGGAGGISVGPDATGVPGASGAYANLLYLPTCGPGNTCPPGLTCDGNNVCVPE